ncbi:23 kDa integral membrane protein-like [Dermacentor andersoni]|uniref:23 kDa integral membrane protein-like n=1 Tax=Dermacentor andersoni TaxID=34620 RepID=UPI0021555DA9|nr:23 kDa integral membrane protein-like [Dermacentor andersoni]XP_054929830.1 23 kDa integral membrane protein-like [Dermacentor andersoni]XP_054929831.1 23 kDa integral membrane protein-like [Dermacentor andersoni]XP_054929832.1 23 kDa integral membrane protein-like [Dermacentor andersoni]
MARLLAARYCLLVSSVFIWVFGIVLLVVGGLLRSDPDVRRIAEYFTVFDNYWAASITTLFVGACLLLVGFLGCCGAFFQSKRLLIAYNVFMVFFVILELAVMGLVWKHAKEEAMDIYLSNAFRRLITKSKNAFVDIEYFLDNIQFKLQCCGGAGPQDYEALEMDYVGSCFYYDHEKEAAAVYQDGCGREMRRFLMGKSLAVGLICLFILLIQVGSIASAIYVLRMTSKPRPKVTAV